MKPSVSKHAFERYLLHHPASRYRDLKSAIRDGVEVSPEDAFTLSAGNPLHVQYHGHACRFVLSPDGLGLFVIKPHLGRENGRLVVVTYLRLPQDEGRSALISNLLEQR